MVLSPQVKDFIKNTLILTVFFTLALHLSWGYVAPMFGLKTDAGANDLSFPESGVTYLGTIATATSISIGQKEKFVFSPTGAPGSVDPISITEVLANPVLGQQRLIGNNMLAVSTYANLLSTDVLSMLDQSRDRAVALDDHIALLKNYYNRSNDRLQIIDEQIADLRGIINAANSSTTTAKNVMQSSFTQFDYTGVDTAIDSYIQSRDRDTRARVYLIYLENFKKSYTTLQIKARKLVETLSVNRDPLIKRTGVVIPNSGSDLVKELKLIQTEAQVQASKTLE